MDLLRMLFTRQVPADYLLTTFGVPHLAYLALEVVALAGICLWLRNLAPRKAKRFLTVLAWVVLCGWIVPVALMCSTDPATKWINNLPLHLCSASSLVTPVALWKRNKLLLNVAYSLGLPGAAFALATPESQYMHFAWFSVHFFNFNVSHFTLVLAPLAAMATGMFKPDIRYAPKVILTGLAFCAAVYPVNKLLDTNFLFANWPEPGTILEPMGQAMGNPGYLLGVGALGVSIIYLMYGLYYLFRRLGRHRSGESAAAARAS